MTKKSVLIIDSIDNLAIEKLGKRFLIDYQPKLSREQLLSKIKNVNILIVRSGHKVDRELLKKANKLEIIARAGTGLNNIDIKTANERNIKLFKVPSVNSLSVAEFVIGVMICLSRNIINAHNYLKNNIWKKSESCGNLLNGKTLGIIGYGSIGKKIAMLSKAFNMKILASVKNYSEKRKKEAEKIGVKLTDNESILKQSDFIVLSVPLTGGTRNLINSKSLGIMKKSAFLINVSRGGVVNESDLYYALKNNFIKGAALDVFSIENESNRLFGLNNVIVTPHIGAMTFEVQKLIGEELEKGILRLLE